MVRAQSNLDCIQPLWNLKLPVHRQLSSQCAAGGQRNCRGRKECENFQDLMMNRVFMLLTGFMIRS